MSDLRIALERAERAEARAGRLEDALRELMAECANVSAAHPGWHHFEVARNVARRALQDATGGTMR